MMSFCRIFVFIVKKQKEKRMINRPDFMFLVGPLKEVKITQLYHQSKSTHLTCFFCDCETHVKRGEIQRVGLTTWNNISILLSLCSLRQTLMHKLL